MAAGNAVWGIDIGQCALKALKLRSAGDGKVEAVAFDLIEHPKLLSQPDADPEELIRGALEKFASRNDWQGDQFVIGVPGQQTFARFCKMPPVDQKKVPDLVRFEASQQIPFDIDEVVWDYQTFSAADSPDLEVGIFAMRKDLIRKHIEYFSNLGIAPVVVQTIPSALYNFYRFDASGGGRDEGAAVLINVGCQNTDLVIVEPNSAWTRNIPLGGNSFSEALVRSFKLSFAKAESLKRTAATSKYARQIFQAMRPVFAELVAEIQRSIGFYSSTHREVELKHVLAVGNAFRLPGLQKYLENNLTIPGGVARLEKFARLLPSATINAPQFVENILTFAAAYGLAVQGLGLAHITASLLPSELARIAVWKKKRPYFIAAAACLGLAAVLPYTRTFLDQQALASGQAEDSLAVTEKIIREATDLRDRFNKVKTNTAAKEQEIKQLTELQKGKALVPTIFALVHEAMPEMNAALAAVKTPDDLKKLVESGKLRRTERRQLLIDSLSVEYVPDLGKVDLTVASAAGMSQAAEPLAAVSGDTMVPGSKWGGPRGMVNRPEVTAAVTAGPSEPGFHVRISGRLLFGETQGAATSFLTDYKNRLRELFSRAGLGFYIPDDDPKDKTKKNISDTTPLHVGSAQPGAPPGVGRGAIGVPVQETEVGANKDPVTGENMSTDWAVQFAFKVKLGEKPQPDAVTTPGGK